MNRPWIRLTLVLVIFAVAFLTLTVASYRRESATVDEPQHVVGGYIAWKLHDYRVAPEHPPFLRMWATLPLLAMSEIKLDTNGLPGIYRLGGSLRGLRTQSTSEPAAIA